MYAHIVIELVLYNFIILSSETKSYSLYRIKLS